MKKIILLIILFTISCSKTDKVFNRVNYVDSLYTKNCTALDIEKKFVSKSNEQLSKNLNDKSYIASDIAATTLGFGLPMKEGQYSSHSYFEKRLEQNNFKLEEIQKEKERKLCQN